MVRDKEKLPLAVYLHPLHWAGREYSSGSSRVSNGQDDISRPDGCSCFWLGQSELSRPRKRFMVNYYSMIKCTLLLIAILYDY